MNLGEKNTQKKQGLLKPGNRYELRDVSRALGLALTLMTFAKLAELEYFFFIFFFLRSHKEGL